MSDSRAATGFDRLPWLADEPRAKATPPKLGGRELLGWAAAAVLLVGGASFWLEADVQAATARRIVASCALMARANCNGEAHVEAT